MTKRENAPTEIDDGDLDAAIGGAGAKREHDYVGNFKVEIEGVTQGALQDSYETTKKIVGAGGGSDI
ncbi:MAG: hypothetical protein AAFN51_11050 [Pseudomonadota bacterium]